MSHLQCILFIFQPKEMKPNTNNVDQNPQDYEDEEEEAANDYLPPPTRYFISFTTDFF